MKPLRILGCLGLVALTMSLVAPPALSSSAATLNETFVRRLSGGAQIRYYALHPKQAPASLRTSLERAAGQRLAGRAPVNGPGDRFNHDVTGLPQNEESVGVCPKQPDVVLGGTNDYRGVLDPEFNFTGWYFSTDGGRTLANEGLAPPIDGLASAGDAVDAAGPGCSLYATDLNFNTFDTAAGHSGVGLYRSRPSLLGSCPGGTDPSCWSAKRLVATNAEGHFLDKPWMTVGDTGDGVHVWVTYTDFNCTNADCSPPFTNQIRAVRCTDNLMSCTRPILISGNQDSLQFSDVTIGEDGRTYITWEEDNDLKNNFAPPEKMRFWIRVAEAGSTTFGPLHRVADEPLNLGLADLHANDFRVSTVPKNTVAMVNGHPRVFLTWDGCRVRVNGDTVCEEPVIKVTYSDDRGATWSTPKVVSKAGDNYFPTIATDPITGTVVIAYYTTRFDSFHNGQDVELVSLRPASASVFSRKRVTSRTNDPEADPALGGAFIGDYFEVAAVAGTAYVHYNANYDAMPLVGEGVPVNQQDNFLTRVSTPPR